MEVCRSVTGLKHCKNVRFFGWSLDWGCCRLETMPSQNCLPYLLQSWPRSPQQVSPTMLWREGKRCFFTCKVGAQLLSWKTTSLLLTGHVDSPCRQPPTFKHVHTGSYTSVPSLQMFYHLITLIFFQGIMRSAFIARESSAEISVLKSILARSCCHSSRDRAATSCCTPNDSHRPRLSLYSDDG